MLSPVIAQRTQGVSPSRQDPSSPGPRGPEAGMGTRGGVGNAAGTSMERQSTTAPMYFYEPFQAFPVTASVLRFVCLSEDPGPHAVFFSCVRRAFS